MKDVNKKIQELIEQQNELHHSWRLVSASIWSEKKWAEERAISEKVSNELKKLVPIRIAELKKEKNEIEQKYPKFSKRLRYIFRVPKDVVAAENRYNEIISEIQILELYLK